MEKLCPHKKISMGTAFPLHYTPEYAVKNWVKINLEKTIKKLIQ